MLDAESISNGLNNMVPPLGKANFAVLEAEPGKVRCTMPLEGNNNHLGSVYAGMLFSFAEAAAGALLLATVDVSSIKIMVRGGRIEFHRLALTDVFADVIFDSDRLARVMGEVANEGKAFFEFPVEIKDANGDKVATAIFDYRFRAIS